MMMTTKLEKYYQGQLRKIFFAGVFELKHRAWLEAHDADYVISDEGGLLFECDKVALVAAKFGSHDWAVCNGAFTGHEKIVDGLKIKVWGEHPDELCSTMRSPLVSGPALKPSAHLDVVGNEGCKASTETH